MSSSAESSLARPEPEPESEGRPTTARVAERLFEVPEPYRKAALAWLDHGMGIQGSAPRRAAAVVFVRDGDEGVETLMLHRPTRKGRGTLTFPGGNVEASDDEPLTWHGPSPTEWAQRLDSEDIGDSRRTVVAAARHAFVETGAFFAGSPGFGPAESVDGADWMRSRERLAVLEVSFADVLAKRSFSFRSELLRPFGRWMTSDFVHQRVDQQFFTAVIPVGQRCSQLASRRDSGWLGWVDAATLLHHPQHTGIDTLFGADTDPESGEAILAEVLTPGVRTALEAVASARSAIGFLAARRDQRLNSPVLEVRDGRPVLVLER